jgi:hypothetical protein
MSLYLLKNALPKRDQVVVPSKRKRSSKEIYNDLIQQEIDNRLLRPQKIKKPKKKFKTLEKPPLLESIEQARPNPSPDSTYTENIKILQSRKLPEKYIKLLKKS